LKRGLLKDGDVVHGGEKGGREESKGGEKRGERENRPLGLSLSFSMK
jgi:hypothetical protein